MLKRLKAGVQLVYLTLSLGASVFGREKRRKRRRELERQQGPSCVTSSVSLENFGLHSG